MKTTKKNLQKIIREEVKKLISEDTKMINPYLTAKEAIEEFTKTATPEEKAHFQKLAGGTLAEIAAAVRKLTRPGGRKHAFGVAALKNKHDRAMAALKKMKDSQAAQAALVKLYGGEEKLQRAKDGGLLSPGGIGVEPAVSADVDPNLTARERDIAAGMGGDPEWARDDAESRAPEGDQSLRPGLMAAFKTDAKQAAQGHAWLQKAMDNEWRAAVYADEIAQMEKEGLGWTSPSASIRWDEKAQKAFSERKQWLKIIRWLEDAGIRTKEHKLASGETIKIIDPAHWPGGRNADKKMKEIASSKYVYTPDAKTGRPLSVKGVTNRDFWPANWGPNPIPHLINNERGADGEKVAPTRAQGKQTGGGRYRKLGDEMGPPPKSSPPPRPRGMQLQESLSRLKTLAGLAKEEP